MKNATASIIACLAAIAPVQAWAHSAERGLVLLLPTEWYVAGGALAVLASFLLLGWIPARAVTRAFDARYRLFAYREPARIWTSMAAFVLLALLLACGIYGSRDPLSNPLPLVVWTGWWVLFTLIQALVGDLWRFFNPWSGPARLVRKLFRLRNGYLGLPDRAGFCVAVVQFFSFAWFELVYIAPEDPARLAVAIMFYWLINFLAVLVFGEKSWFGRAEPFSVFFRLVGAMSPLWRKEQAEDRSELFLVVPGDSLARKPALPWSGVVFVLLTLSTVSYDGWARTFAWLELIGVNPLEFPGRSALVVQSSAGLVVAGLLLVMVFLLCTYSGFRLSRVQESFLQFAGRLIYSMIPISLMFHCAHYLTQVLVNGQYLVLSLNDPLGTGRNLLGLDGAHVTTSFLNHLEPVILIWGFQTAVIVVGHVVGIVMAHRIALDQCQDSGQAFRSQVFLAGLMVLYTVFGLWLLSTPAIG